jgi:hypothetical protein
MWKLPWVSRERLEEAERRLEASDVERQRLLDLLLSGVVPDRTKQIQQAAAAAYAGGIAGTERLEEIDNDLNQPVPFSTPFDRVLDRFGTTFGKGPIPAKFRARV